MYIQSRLNSWIVFFFFSDCRNKASRWQQSRHSRPRSSTFFRTSHSFSRPDFARLKAPNSHKNHPWFVHSGRAHFHPLVLFDFNCCVMSTFVSVMKDRICPPSISITNDHQCLPTSAILRLKQKTPTKHFICFTNTSLKKHLPKFFFPTT